MLQTALTVHTEKAEKYQDMLSKHFARKVEVTRQASQATIHFPMGICYFSVANNTMHFLCEAQNEDALEAVKGIISGHVPLLKELKNIELNWQST
ncbi:DUF2218 domain-containing protein [Litoribacillus peritrichatus]|uniref:DUF2218 domain-containing protein n=1 Tax=Litoribacillus peritrichatus TaxID=718191 RepID=A0ABP7MV01_9GAMM